ncbi:MAG: YidH family protein [Thermoplasmataceae archaeon]
MEKTTVTDHLANERTYLAWVRTGISVMALGFVVAKFGIIIKELVPNSGNSSAPFSSAIGIILVISGGFMQTMALRSYLKNKTNIDSGNFTPSFKVIIFSGILIILVAILLIMYMIITL